MNRRLVFFAFATAGLASAADANFGLIGIAGFETGRLTAYCDGSVAPTPCDITFEFHDMSGRTVKQASMTLQPGTGGFLDFTPAEGQPPDPVRGQIDPCWKLIRGVALASLEVFDNFSLRTRILINWGDRSMPRSGDVDFGLAGITSFDTARLSAFCTDEQIVRDVPPGPCDVTFEFHDINGRTLKQSRMTLQPGTGGFLDLRWQETGSPARRVEAPPCLKVGGGAAVGSLTIVDNFTGLSIAQAYPAALASGAQ